MKLTENQILQNWEKLMNIIDTDFPSRKDALKAMYEENEERMVMMPASSFEHYHGAYAGGYVYHILNVYNCAKLQLQIWKDAGADVSGFTEEELLFVALHHDLGKMGYPGKGNHVYEPNTSDWHVKNQGKIYSINPNNPFMMTPDLSLYLLQYYNITLSFNEYLGIKIHDGLYDDSNKPYYISRSKDSKFKNPLPYIIHHADMMAATIEYQQWLGSAATGIKMNEKKKEKTTVSNTTPLKFDNIFD